MNNEMRGLRGADAAVSVSLLELLSIGRPQIGLVLSDSSAIRGAIRVGFLVWWLK
jgi:hypothetical protein